MGRSLKHFFALVLLLAALPASAAQISVPSSIGPGFLLQSLSTGVYATVKLIAGTNVTISTTTSAITINSSGSGSGFSTTSADYWATVRNFFSTTSADYWKTQNNFFSTTSANLWATFGLGFSTSSATYFLAQNQGSAFSTTSANLWGATRGFIATGTPFVASNLLYFGTAGTVFNVATSTLTPTAPLGGSFIQVGSGGSVTCTTAASGVAGCLSNTSFDTFNNKQAAISVSEPIILTGAAVSFNRDWIVRSAGGYLAPTTTIGAIITASSTIGAGALTSGLTINGGATTTGVAYFGSNVGIGTTTPYGLLGLGAPGGSAPLFVIGSSTEVMSVYSANHAQLSIGSTTPWAQFSINPTNLNLAAPSFAIGSTTLTQFEVLNNGNVGVATATAGTLFSVGGALNITTGTSTFVGTGGVNITSGCFAIRGTCIAGTGGSGTVTSITTGEGFWNRGINFTTTGTLTVGIATSTNPTQGQVPYWTGIGDGSVPARLGSTATSSLAGGGPITVSNSPAIFGASTATLGCTSANNVTTGCLTSADHITFATAVATGTPFIASNIPYFGTNGTLFNVATSTLTPSAPLTGSFTYIGTGGTLSIPAATNAVNGYLTAANHLTYSSLVATGTASVSSNLTYWGNNGTLFNIGTSTLSASGPLTGSFVQVGSGGALGCTTAASGVAGCLSNTSFDIFNNKQATISVTEPAILTGAALSINRDWIVKGAGGWLAPTTTIGMITLASSTIGAGAQTTGLTINGGATTTANAFFNSTLGIGTTSPWGLLSLNAASFTGPMFTIGSSTKTTAFQVTSGRQTATCLTTYGATGEVATSTAMNLDWTGTCPAVDIKIGNAATTITLFNATTSNMSGSRKMITVCNPNQTASTVTFVGAEWYGGTAPTQTVTAGYCDSYSFHVTSGTSTLAAPAYKVFGAQSAGAQ